LTVQVLQVKQEDYDRKKAAMGRMEVEVRNAEERERIASDVSLEVFCKKS
jgi:hypothetical protein